MSRVVQGKYHRYGISSLKTPFSEFVHTGFVDVYYFEETTNFCFFSNTRKLVSTNWSTFAVLHWLFSPFRTYLKICYIVLHVKLIENTTKANLNLSYPCSEVFLLENQIKFIYKTTAILIHIFFHVRIVYCAKCN